MRISVIINPVAGASPKRPGVRSMIDRLEAGGMQVAAFSTARPDHARELSARAAQRSRAVIAVGGDGTVRDVAEGLADTGVPLIVWPTGTENLVAKALGFRADAERVLSCLIAGRPRRIDVGQADGRCFLVVAGIGFDAEVVQRLSRIRDGHITHLTYSGPIWRTFWEHRFPHFRVSTDAGLIWEGRGLVFLGNMARYSLGLRVIRDAIDDDGWLDLCIFECRNKLDLIGHSLRTLCRRHVEHPRVFYRRVQWARVESTDREVPLELDGDCCGRLPLAFSVRPGALLVQVPPTARRR